MLLLLAAACTVGPNFEPQPAPVGEKFRGAHNSSVKSNRQDYENWWRVFHDPTLDRLIQIAYDQNLTLLSAGTRVLQARAALGIAIGIFYPQVQQGIGSLIYNRTSAATPLAGPNATPAYFWTDALAVQAAWELDFWGKFRRGVESADGAYLASIASYDDVLVSLLGDVAATYIGIRATEQQIAIARSNIRKQEQILAIADAKYRGGGTSERNVFQATNVLEATRAVIPQLTIQLEQGQNALSVCGWASHRSRSPPCSRVHGAGFRCRQRASLSASRRICCAAARTSARLSSPHWRRARRSASPRRSFTRRSASPARSAARPAPPMATTSAKSSLRRA
jgi:outer membrane protein TolC